MPLLLAAALATLLVYAARPRGGSSEVAYVGCLGIAAVLAWVGVARCEAGQRRAWTWVALGVSLSASADLVYQVMYWVRGFEPDVSIADVPWLASYPALVVGLMALDPPRRRRGRVDVDALIDSMVAAVIAMVVLWEAALADLVSDSSVGVLPRVVWAAYPILDVVILAMVVRVAVDRRRGLSASLVVVSLGAVCWLVADFGFLIDGDGSAVTWLSLGWMVAALLLGSGALVAGTRPAEAEDEVTAVRRPMWAVMWPMLLPAALEVRGYVTGDDANAVVLALATVALVALATARGHRLLRDAEEARATVAAREHHFRTLTANSADAVVVLDERGRVREGSDNLAAMVGIDPATLVGVPITEAPEVADPSSARAFLEKAQASPGTVLDGELRARHGDGRDLFLAARVVNLLDDPTVAGIVVNLHDVTDRKRAEEELAHQAFHDGLTGLANRALFTDRAEQSLRRGARTGTQPAVIYLDIDGFKSVNDRFGHAAGDALLQEVADRLRSAIRATDTVARLGGDELAILIEEHHHHAAEATTTADRILQAMSVPIEVDGQLIAVSASIGVAMADATSTAATLLRNADIAMYRAKAAGKARVVVYDAEMGTAAGEALQLQTDLAGAIERGEMVLHYQPVVELEGETVVGFEALVRWEHPTLGLLAPDRFIPLAEETGLIVPLGQWVLSTACRTAAGWSAAHDRGGLPPLTMAVNLSGRQLASDQLVTDVRTALATSGLDPHSLVLEMTETALVVDPVAAARRLQALSDLGVRLAVDDFGTGYSSLSYLRQFPIHILKIDRSFVETITTEDSQLPPIVRGLLDLGHTLDLEIVAEGIELDVQRTWLREAHCDLGQGYLFSRPQPADEAERLIGEVQRTT